MGSYLTTTIQTEQPRIYVACLAAYNSGYLHGAWVDAAREPWALWDDVQSMLAASPIPDAEEWAIHDYEGFGRMRISEHASLETVTELAAFIDEHGALGAAALYHFGGELDEARNAMNNRYMGRYSCLAEYVQELTEETTEIPGPLRYYIDWKAMARDAENNGDVFTLQTSWDEIHVFAER